MLQELIKMEKKLQKIYDILQFMDRGRFMASSLSNLDNNLSEGIHRIKCKYGYDDKKSQTFGIKFKHCNCFLQYTNFRDYLIEYKCLCCNKNYQHKFDERLKELFFNTYQFSNHNNISLFYCCMFIHIWMIGKILMKHRYLKKKIFTVLI